MAKRDKKQPREPEQTAAEFYRLNTRAVEDLVTADESNAPEVSPAELRKYQGRRKLHVADWLKAVLIKWWLSGVVCYFFVWGLGLYVPNKLDLLVITGAALGFVKDLVENNIFRFYATVAGGNDRWMMCPRKGFVSLPINVVYAMLLVFCVSRTYDTLNTVWLGLRGPDAAVLGVGPILFGLFSTLWDLLFLAVKHGIQRIVHDARRKVDASKGEHHD